jgi:hypothetical protein
MGLGECVDRYFFGVCAAFVCEREGSFLAKDCPDIGKGEAESKGGYG